MNILEIFENIERHIGTLQAKIKLPDDPKLGTTYPDNRHEAKRDLEKTVEKYEDRFAKMQRSLVDFHEYLHQVQIFLRKVKPDIRTEAESIEKIKGRIKGLVDEIQN